MENFQKKLLTIFLCVFLAFCTANCSKKNYNPYKSNLEFLKSNNNKFYDLNYPKLLEIFCNRTMSLPDGWKQLDLDGDNKPDFYTNKNSGFEATAFIKNKTILIAIRGMNHRTVLNKDFFKDCDGYNAKEILLGNLGIPVMGKVPGQFYDAITFYNLINKKYPDYKIIITGKSLGGSLAELVGAVSGADTYTFAAPGMAYALPKLDPKYKLNIESNSRKGFKNIKNYYNLNDPCGNYGKHLGQSFVHPPIPVKKYVFYDIHGDISHFATQSGFDKIIPLPKDWKYQHTAALVASYEQAKEELKAHKLWNIVLIRFQVDHNDLKEAHKLINNYFGHLALLSDQNDDISKIIVSGYKCDFSK